MFLCDCNGEFSLWPGATIILPAPFFMWLPPVSTLEDIFLETKLVNSTVCERYFEQLIYSPTRVVRLSRTSSGSFTNENLFIHSINRKNHFTGYFNGFTYRKQVKYLRKALLSCSICVTYFCCDICVTYFIFLGISD